MNIDFILGIFTGITLAILYGHFLHERARKHQREQQKQLFDYFFGKRPSSLDQQLQDAISREDFKEAARIRDLMNKK